MQIGEKVRRLRERRGMSQAALAQAIGMTQQGVQSLEGGESRRPRKLRELARFLDVSEDWLLDDEQGVERIPANYNAIEQSHVEFAGQFQIAQLTSVHIPIVGRIAAGFFREVETSQWDWNAVRHFPASPFPPDPQYPLAAQYDLRVDGPSVNRFARDGDYIRCVDLRKAPVGWVDGDYVVIERRRGGMVETTAKRVVRTPSGVELRPDSDDPQWQTPLLIPNEGQAHDTDDEIAIIGLVLWVYRPARQPFAR